MLKERKELVLSIERDIETEAKIEIFKQKVKKRTWPSFAGSFTP